MPTVIYHPIDPAKNGDDREWFNDLVSKMIGNGSFDRPGAIAHARSVLRCLNSPWGRAEDVYGAMRRCCERGEFKYSLIHRGTSIRADCAVCGRFHHFELWNPLEV